MIFLKLLSKLIKILRSGEMPFQIAWGFVLGMGIGLISLRSLTVSFLILLVILRDVWSVVFSVPFVPYIRFNNTVLMGSLIVSVVILYQVFVGTKHLLLNYRKRFLHRIRASWVLKILDGSRIGK